MLRLPEIEKSTKSCSPAFLLVYILLHCRQSFCQEIKTAKAHCRALSPWSTRSQPDPDYTKNLSNHRYMNKHSHLHNWVTKHSHMQPSTRLPAYEEEGYCIQPRDCIPNPPKSWSWCHRAPGSKSGKLPNPTCPPALLHLSSCYFTVTGKQHRGAFSLHPSHNLLGYYHFKLIRNYLSLSQQLSLRSSCCL